MNKNSRTENSQTQLFDIRNVIGAVLAIIGVFLVITGLVADPQLDKTGGVNANLWVGIVLVVFGVLFGVWNYLAPAKDE